MQAQNAYSFILLIEFCYLTARGKLAKVGRLPFNPLRQAVGEHERIQAWFEP